ncbi:tyrosine-type recombinase/integrase [Crocosphaera sp.]|uniref:tyrosine-type recombinase/integrase n=1 Tax=Crocosphaera sp. TaxID=2729996 RepID=UPI002617DFF6|nr:tyrosine-type recombinase/integrase [Crocosphaera sp.]MDJ0582959.1 tyrosine-type recombinase/integrase [Crocosphaera sp.]
MSVGGQAKVLNAQEWSRLEKVGQSITHQTIWSLLRFTGCRSQEARLLQVENVYVDPANKVLREMIFFPKEIRKGKKHSISVPITKKLRWYLERYTPNDSGYLFPSPRKPNCPISYEAILKYLENAATKAGMGHEKITTHSGRRSLVTILHGSGTSLETIRQITGHRSLSNLQKYIEVPTNQVASAIDNIAL